MKIFIILLLIPVCWGNVVCPGGEYSCPDGYTCCQLPDERWGCCPFPNGVCCDDHVHCCPSGEQCRKGACYQLNLNSSRVLNVQTTCPGGKYYCPDNSTCCKHPEMESFNCCLLPEATCCSDGESCCPASSFCDLKRKQCIPKHYSKMQKQNMTKLKQPLIPLNLLNSTFAADGIKCPSGKECPDASTCCLIDVDLKIYGCCPLVNAVCCDDHKHCCPEGMDCTSFGVCI